MTTRVLLIRHGETAWNATWRWQGHAPVPLNETGLAQSVALGRYLAAHGYALDALYSSDLPRAMQTAEAVAGPQGLAVQREPRLREVDLGEWQGLTREEAAAWDAENWARYTADRRNVPVPGGESRQAVQVRARAAFDAITARHAGQAVGIVSHGGTLGMLLESLFGQFERPNLLNTSVTIITRDDPGAAWAIQCVAWTPHLEAGGALGETW